MQSKSLTATAAQSLGNGLDGPVSTVALAISFVGGAGSVTIKARVWGSSATAVAIAYTDLTTGALSTAAITAYALLQVEAAGLELFADYTRTGGSCLLEWNPLVG